VPDVSGKELFEQELVSKIIRDREDLQAGSSELADTLEKVADQIDSETNKISCGLLLIGGAVALVKPLLGIGIAAKESLPAIGAKATKASAEYVGNRLRDWNKSSAMSKLRRDASTEVRSLKPRIYPNPIFRSLEAIATNLSTDFDPSFDHRNWVDHFKPLHYCMVTCEAIQEIYRDAWDSLDLRA